MGSKSARMSSAASRLIQKIKPHIPLIKFRKGSLPGTLAAPAVTGPSPSAAAFVQEATAAMAPPPPSTAFKAVQMPVREWWDTPARFKRREVDILECDLINGGGCDKLYQ